METNEIYAPLTLIEPVVLWQDPTVIDIGHLDKIHNVSRLYFLTMYTR